MMEREILLLRWSVIGLTAAVLIAAVSWSLL